MTELTHILRLAQNDFSYFFRTKWLMAVLLSLNLSDMLIVALVYKQLISTFNYFQFFVPAIIIMGLFVAALDTGRRIWLAIREGVTQYYLALPISTQGIVVAYLLAGGLAAMVYSTSLMIIALVVLPIAAMWNALLLLPFLFFLAMGLAGISATLATFASTHGEFFFAYQQVLQVLLLTMSTVYYPIDVVRNYLPAFLTDIVSANPLSQAAQAMRDAFLGHSVPPSSLFNIFLSSLPFTLIGAAAYFIALRTIQTKGKT
jgi:ABC-type polysaccharide/polyol phosphate export permease